MLIALASSIAIALLFGGLWYRERRQRIALRTRVNGLREAAFLQWWTRNAAEMTRADPSRPFLVGLAYAAELAPDFATLLRDLEDIVEEKTLPEGLRNAAKSFAQELRAPRVPWDVWEESGRPIHMRGALDFAYRESLRHLLTRIPITRSLVPQDEEHET
jgi:hypothetical protein